MKKLLFAVVSLVVLCGCLPKTEIEKGRYGEGKSIDSLYLEAKDMQGIGIINIFDTKSEIIRNLKKHNSKYRYKFDNFIQHAEFGDDGVYWNFTLPHEGLYGDKNKLKLSYIVDENKCIDLELMFHRDTLFEIVSNNSNSIDFLRAAFKSKYGDGCGYYYCIRRNNSRGEYIGSKNNTEQIWENDKIKAEYWYSFESDNGELSLHNKFSIKTKDDAFLTRRRNYINEESQTKQRAEDKKKQEQYDKI